MSVVVEPYNPLWPTLFETIKTSLEQHLHDIPILSIEHVGSTSVPGLAAKPILDIDIIAPPATLQPAIDALVSRAHFTYLGELGIADRHALQDPDQLPPRNIYVCAPAAFQTRNHLAVRDTLRADPALRAEYAAVKLELAARGTNIVDYVEAKSEVLQKVLAASGRLSAAEREAVRRASRKGARFGAVRTERLVLREFVLRDVDALFGLESREEVVRYQVWGPRTRGQAHEVVVGILREAGVEPRGHVELVVEWEGGFVGRVGARVGARISRGDLVVPRAELWFSFLPEFQGRGFATEAMRAFIPLVGEGVELEIECDPRNTGSWRLAERLGFTRVSLTEKAFECKGEWVDSLVYRKRVE